MIDWANTPSSMAPGEWRAWVASQKVPIDEVEAWAALTAWIDEFEVSGVTEVTKVQVIARLKKAGAMGGESLATKMSGLVLGLGSIGSLALVMVLVMSCGGMAFWLLLVGICGGF